jgi:hypothetical protein
MKTIRHLPMTERKYQVISLRLMRAQDMFQVPAANLFSEYRNFLSGVDFCVTELRVRPSRRPVRLDIRLPRAEMEDGLAERLAGALRSYCEQRIRYDLREGRSERIGGIAALRIGLPVSAAGLALTGLATTMRPPGGAGPLIIDHVGWVLAWIGLWFPLDQLLFYPLFLGRDRRALRRLAAAEVFVTPDEDTGALRL